MPRKQILRGENVPDCAIAADFVNNGAGATAIDYKMRHTTLQPWVEATNHLLAIPRTNRPMETYYAPGGASLLDSTRNIRAKDDAVDEIERCVAQSTIQDAHVGLFEPVTPRLASIRAVRHVENDQMHMQGINWKGLLTYDGPIPLEPPPDLFFPLNFLENREKLAYSK
jgi:hypothetical protein